MILNYQHMIKKKYQYNNDIEVPAKNTEDSDHKSFHLESK